MQHYYYYYYYYYWTLAAGKKCHARHTITEFRYYLTHSLSPCISKA
jgi:hypothetical protein